MCGERGARRAVGLGMRDGSGWSILSHWRLWPGSERTMGGQRGDEERERGWWLGEREGGREEGRRESCRLV